MSAHSAAMKASRGTRSPGPRAVSPLSKSSSSESESDPNKPTDMRSLLLLVHDDFYEQIGVYLKDQNDIRLLHFRF